ncbi:mycofactocin precursor MftA [Microbacterium sp.]|nr:mycofactocin precursor MftA [Microbacterium sp.]
MDTQARSTDSTAVAYEVIEVDSLVEEVSIDGMCGVY